MTDIVHLEVVQGTDSGARIHVPASGSRLGRSSKNDIVLDDPLLSRHHCRFFFKESELWITDLGSSNDTLVNDRAIQETRLAVGDHVHVGDTVLRVCDVRAPVIAASGSESAPSKVDLGFGAPAAPPRRRRLGIGPLLAAAGAVLVLALAVWIPKLFETAPSPAPIRPLESPEADEHLEIYYEKVEATPENIFRYELTFSPDRVVAVQIDDIANDRHVRKEKQVDPEYARILTQSIQDSGFFSLDEEYTGIQPDVLDLWDLSITIGKRTWRSRVRNRVEPAVFREVREDIEEFGKNELGLWAIQFSPERLVDMANTALLEAKKLFDEREIRYGNLAEALRRIEEADWYLETVEPKPDYYAEIVELRAMAEDALKAKYDDHNFRAERAIRLRDWQNAATELRILGELVPDRSDPRNQDARKKLLDIERRIEAER